MCGLPEVATAGKAGSMAEIYSTSRSAALDSRLSEAHQYRFMHPGFHSFIEAKKQRQSTYGRMYETRHTFASWAVNAGESPQWGCRTIGTRRYINGLQDIWPIYTKSDQK